jgi:hypothetical protein
VTFSNRAGDGSGLLAAGGKLVPDGDRCGLTIVLFLFLPLSK